MEPPRAPISLESELQFILQALASSDRFTCHGKTVDGNPCSNPLGKDTRTELVTIIRSIIEVLNDTGEGFENLPEKLSSLSSLVMCVRHRQPQATETFKAWSKRIPIGNRKSLHDGGDFEVSYQSRSSYTAH
jgi:hypothetical protein